MAYEPTSWKTGDVVTSAKLNKIENGIADAGGGGIPAYADIPELEVEEENSKFYITKATVDAIVANPEWIVYENTEVRLVSFAEGGFGYIGFKGIGVTYIMIAVEIGIQIGNDSPERYVYNSETQRYELDETE